jgi:hypothetical protein
MSLRMNRYIGIVAAMVATSPSVRAQAAATATRVSVCRSADDLTARTLNDLRVLVSSADTFQAALRDSVGLSYQPVPRVLLDTIAPHCEQRVVTLNAQLQTPGVARRVYLYRIGKELGIEDPTYGTKSEYRGIYIFGPDWRPRPVLLTY